MTEFSTRAMLDVTVSERSLSQARTQIESQLGGRSVRANVSPAMSDGGQSAGRNSVRDLLETSNELLVQIRDAIEEGNFASSGGGGGGATLLGVGVGTIAKGALTGGALAGGLGIAELLKRQVTDAIPDLPGGGGTQQPGAGAGVPVEIGTDPLSILQNVGEGLREGFAEASPQFRRTVLDAVTDAFAASGSVLERAIRATQLGETIAGGIRSTLRSVRLRRPDWVRSLLNFSLPTPQWVTDLQTLVGGPGGTNQSATPRGGTGRAAGVPATRIPGQTGMQVDVSVDGSGLQRDMQEALSRALRTRDLEQFLVETVRDEFF